MTLNDFLQRITRIATPSNADAPVRLMIELDGKQTEAEVTDLAACVHHQTGTTKYVVIIAEHRHQTHA